VGLQRCGSCSKTLLDNMPAIVSHWDGRQGLRGTDAVMKLKEALSEAIEHLEWPFGRYDRQTGQNAFEMSREFPLFWPKIRLGDFCTCKL